MKQKLFMFFVIFGMLFVVNASAQAININKLPKYVVVAATNGGVLSDIDVDIRIKKSKYRSELKKLEKRLNNDDFVETYTDLLNEMDELGFEFVDSFANEVQDKGIIADQKVRQNLIFRKKGS